ncbi:LysR family transcriptional regulator [Pseudohongiella nitratireducens]|uniref:LysR family transcriptional regulator n=1 Tax=Pseudohongiella nitratireducens TaxID=1768907 RepID=A0A916QJF0_9GAMM|nr:LysR family transcriptional regulator [Pseudohongiella nitratireducens]GFZ75823.1 LysR family transcriptional regulator [Pseudohongiella nitratireducens]
MYRSPRITLDQWAAFQAVVEEGSFAGAAERLNKSQSSISYAVAKLNEQLPAPVLQLQGRKAVLTDEGHVMYRRATLLLNQAGETEDVANMIASGLESEVTLAVDGLMEPTTLVPVLEQFSQDFPSTRLRILETQLSGTVEMLLEKKADLVIGGQVPVGYLGTPVDSCRMIPVAHPEHPLFNRENGDAINDYELRSWRQIVLRDTGIRRNQDAGWLGSEQRWTVSHFSTAVKVLKAGLGFAFLPQSWIEEELNHGLLKMLPLAWGAERHLTLYLMVAATDAAGPATRALADIIVANCPSQSLTD